MAASSKASDWTVKVAENSQNRFGNFSLYCRSRWIRQLYVRDNHYLAGVATILDQAGRKAKRIASWRNSSRTFSTYVRPTADSSMTCALKINRCRAPGLRGQTIVSAPEGGHRCLTCAATRRLRRGIEGDVDPKEFPAPLFRWNGGVLQSDFGADIYAGAHRWISWTLV